MNKTRNTLILSAALIFAALAVFQVFGLSNSARLSGRSVVGMGDLHRFEALKANRPAVGMGDLHRFEALKTSRQTVGMGDLHRFEALKAASLSAGMGDLQRLNAEQADQTAGK